MTSSITQSASGTSSKTTSVTKTVTSSTTTTKTVTTSVSPSGSVTTSEETVVTETPKVGSSDSSLLIPVLSAIGAVGGIALLAWKDPALCRKLGVWPCRGERTDIGPGNGEGFQLGRFGPRRHPDGRSSSTMQQYRHPTIVLPPHTPDHQPTQTVTQTDNDLLQRLITTTHCT